jgi:hypothetical protein
MGARREAGELSCFPFLLQFGNGGCQLSRAMAVLTVLEHAWNDRDAKYNLTWRLHH